MTDPTQLLGEGMTSEGNADVSQTPEKTDSDKAETQRMIELSLKLEQASSTGKFVRSMKKTH